jgi:hypothetical protein
MDKWPAQITAQSTIVLTIQEQLSGTVALWRAVGDSSEGLSTSMSVLLPG